MTAEAADQHLPETVRARIVGLAADVLPRVKPLPPALKRVADFAPARRAKLGGNQIALILGVDDEFRGHVATQAAVAVPELATAVKSGEIPQTAEPADVAALAWLLRPDGWEETFNGALASIESRVQAQDSERDSVEVDRLRAKLTEAEQGMRDLRAKQKAQIDTLKAENTTLRRKLGDSRAAEKAAQAAATEAATQAGAAASAAQASASTAEAELRRLRTRVAELEATVAAARKDVRADRDDASLKARLLLDTLLDAAQGLRRELALPTVSGAPADRIEAELSATTEAGVRDTSAAGNLGPSSPALLESYLAMPRARLIIDGYNVSKTAWPESSLEAQRIRLLQAIAPLVARSGAETTVVFDAATSESRPPVSPPRGVKVIFSPLGVIADDVIRQLVDAEPRGRVIIVVTSDQEVVRDVRRAGARSVASDALIGTIKR